MYPNPDPDQEMDGKGFAFGQRHVAAFLQDATDTMLAIGTLPPMSRAQADQATYNNYPAMVKRSHTHHIDVQHDYTCHPHHAGERGGRQDVKPDHSAANRRGGVL